MNNQLRFGPKNPFVLPLLAIVVLVGVMWLDAPWGAERVAGQASPIDSPAVPSTPTKVPRTVNELVHPGSGDAIAGETEIIGTAVIVNFMRYDVHIARAGEDRWAWVYSSAEVVHDDVLLVLNTRGYADGRYDLRVRAVNMEGQFSEAFINNLQIRNSRPPTPTPSAELVPRARTLLPTPTATPDMRARLPGGTGLYAPDFGSVLRGTVEVVGAVGGIYRNPLMRWDVELAQFNTENWTVIRSGSDQGIGLTLATLDTTQYEDGLYDLRLRVTYQDGTFSDYFLRQLSIANRGDPQFAFLPQPGIRAPQSGSTFDVTAGAVDADGLLAVVATIPARDLMHWELAWSAAGAESWNLLTTGDRPATEAEVAQLDLRQMPSGSYDLRLRIVQRIIPDVDESVPSTDDSATGEAADEIARVVVPGTESIPGTEDLPEDASQTDMGLPEDVLPEDVISENDLGRVEEESGLSSEVDESELVQVQDYFVRGIQIIGLPPATHDAGDADMPGDETDGITDGDVTEQEQ